MNINAFVFGNVLVGFFFVFFGFFNVYHWKPTLEEMSQRGLPHPYLILAFLIGWETVLGFMIIFGLYARLAALLLIPFVVIAAFTFYPFWKFHAERRAMNLSMFVAYMTICLGALFVLLSS